WLPERRVDAVTTGCSYSNLRSDVTESGFGACLTNTRDTEHSLAVRRHVDRATLVTGRGHDEDPVCGELVHDRLVSGSACTFSTQAQVDDLRGVRVGWNTWYIQSGGPAHRRDDVRVFASAFAHDANR